MPASLLTAIEERFRAARLDRDSFAVETLNTVRASLRNAEIAKQGSLTEEDALKVLRRELRQLREAREALVKSGAATMAEEAGRRADLLEPLLPPEMPEAELLKVIEEEVAALGPDCKLGPAMGRVMARLEGVSGKRVRDLLARRLSES